jgi:hypothetical protein
MTELDILTEETDEAAQRVTPCRFYLTVQTLLDEAGTAHTAYGIECRDALTDCSIDHTPALFFDMDRARAVLACLNRNDLSRYHFREVIEDILAE